MRHGRGEAKLYVCLALWLALFANINTGPWLVDDPHTLWDWITAARVYDTFPVLLVSAILVASGRKLPSIKSPLSLLAIYGVVALCSGLASPNFLYATYWSVAFLATIGTYLAFLTTDDFRATAGKVVTGAWMASVVITIAIVISAPESIFRSDTGYFIYREVNGQVISSGVARWASVMALGALVRAFYARLRVLRMLLVGVGCFGIWIVYRMQSRGAIFSIAGALLLMLALQKQARILGFCGLAIFLALAVFFDSSADSSILDNTTTYLERGGSAEGIYTMSGRTAYYARGWEAFKEAPLIGRGQWADRLLEIGHIHNAYLQALLNAGIVGFIPFVLSWIAGWRLFFHFWRARDSLEKSERQSLLECALIMVFFFIRSIPETTTASYAPDLLFMGAVYCYLQALSNGVRGRRKRVLIPRSLSGEVTTAGQGCA